MPIYEYLCESCNHQFEEQQGMKDDPLHECPLCKGNVRRLFGLSSVIFKGKGFYCTDTKPCAESKESSPCSNCPASGT